MGLKRREKIPVMGFLCYAHEDKRLVSNFRRKFSEQARAAKRYSYKVWTDHDIHVGDKWREEIQQALRQCDMGILLVSPNFIGSEFIGECELSEFVGESDKAVVPVMLKPVDFQEQELKGLEEHQIFRLDRERFAHPKAFAECRDYQRDEFAQKLLVEIQQKLGEPKS